MKNFVRGNFEKHFLENEKKGSRKDLPAIPPWKFFDVFLRSPPPPPPFPSLALSTLNPAQT